MGRPGENTREMAFDANVSTRAPVAGPDWGAVVARLGPREGELTLAELDELGRAHWWLRHADESTRLDQVQHERLLADGRVVEAAERALRVGLQWAIRGDLTVASTWLARARRLLRDQPPSVVHSYADYVLATADLDLDTDPSEALEVASRLRDMADAYDDRTLDCFALGLTGMATVRSGDLTGFEVLDEALLPIVDGQVDPLWAGDLFCSVIHLCEGLGDLARMRAWTDTLAAWASPLSDTFLYAGVTRVHQLQLLRAEGRWDEVVAEMGEQSDQLAPAHSWLAGAGFHELGEVHRLRGDRDAAQAAYDRARELGIEPEPGQALLHHAAGRTDEALAGLRVAMAAEGPLSRSRVIGPAVRLALDAGERQWAASLVDELEATARRFGTPGLVAAASHARAVLLSDAGRYDDAVPLLEDAARIYREQRYRHASAQVHEALAVACRGRGDVVRADAEEATARAIYDRLGARADLARLSVLAAPGGLTAREVQVLAQVAAGLTNKQVAEALVISDKTVSRHLASIFTKIGVSSRTAAAAWAREHGVA
ncbi:helix-turn-helix transcriptional regulator [Nocardioides seonyuensis]|uniref:Helix-turn-helix transcriptional regulator n=1 Tax=Nocardioides seonyuensis TaxID=2518371 RepID=A0A4P7IEX1_9ACTN|nr:helix-turn-helix transcriptional regulator [Nocardioides seonyuensis]